MESLGTQRRSFILKAPPPVLFRSTARRSAPGSATIPRFEPYEENLPLQSGYYSFVIDEDGDFRVKMGNTSSHGAMVGNHAAGAAGNFRINKVGKLAEVLCISTDYRIRFSGPDDRVVHYVIQSFLGHPAFDVSDHVVFRFRRDLADILDLDHHGNPLNQAEYRNKLRLLDLDGNGDDISIAFNPAQIEGFSAYRPEPPPRLHPMHRDQLIIAIEEGDDDRFEFGPPEPAYSIEQGALASGKNNFVIDADGRLIIGVKGHHILSGGADVGGAGHIKIEDSGEVSEIQLNFSGHYRPPLSIEYCRYVFRAITEHPLLTMKPGYLVQGRIFDEETVKSVVIRFDPEDLITENDITDEHIERLLI